MAAWLPYLVAIAATLAAALWRLILAHWLGGDLPYLTFYGAIVAAAWYGGLRPGLLATALSAVITTSFFLVPRIEAVGLKPAHVVGILIFAATGWLISAGAEGLRRTREEHRLEAERLRTTLQSIGDGVVVTDAAARVVSLNAVAERLTGWSSEAATGRALDEIFRIVNEDTRQPVDNPALRSLREGAVIGLANHTILIGRDGTEWPIDDSAAPVRAADGTVAGSVLVFRDVSDRRRTEQTLRASEEELSDFFENASVGLHWIDADGRILRANKTELAMLGYAAEEYVGQPVTGFHADRPVVDEMLDRLARGETLRNFPARLRCRDGSIRHVLISSNARWERGRLAHSRCVVLDVTERRQTDEIRGLLAAVVESTEDAVITKSLEGHILSWNAGARAMLGYAAEDVVGRSVNVIIPDSRRDEELEILERVKEAKRVEPFETQRVARDGRIVDVSLTVSPIRDSKGVIVGASKIARDITERTLAQDALRRAHEELEDRVRLRTAELSQANESLRNEMDQRQRVEQERGLLFTRLVLAQEDERRRMARELHDQLGQQLTALRLTLETLKALSSEHPEVHKQVEALQHLARQLDQDIAFRVWELRPAVLDGLGLAAALSEYAGNWSKRFGIRAELHITRPTDERLPLETETTIYRFAQEALNNVVKHARAERVDIVLEHTHQHVSLIVEDNGIGFNAAEARTTVGGFGLIGMRERAALANADFQIESAPGKGTTIVLRVPTTAARTVEGA
jgi:PAS domain S-box-containing protein